MNASDAEPGSHPSLPGEGDEGEQPPNTSAVAAVDVVDATESLDAATMEWLCASARRVVALLAEDGLALDRISVRLVGDEEMSGSHESYAGVSGTTDVLAFVAEAQPLEIDILACIDEARRRAEEFDHDHMHELVLYIVHGLLHGLGHDDRDEASSRRMHEAEDALLQRAGIGRVYDPADDGRESR